MATKSKINLYNSFLKFMALVLVIAGMSAITVNISNPKAFESTAVFIEGESYYNEVAGNHTAEAMNDIGTLNFAQKNQEGRAIFYSSLAGLAAILAGALWLMIFAGQRSREDEVEIRLYDRIYFDLLLFITFWAELGFGAGFVMLNIGLRESAANSEVLITLLWMLSALFVLYNLFFTINFAKRIKRREILKYTFIYKLFSSSASVFRRIWFSFKKKTSSFKASINAVTGEKIVRRLFIWICIVMLALFGNMILSMGMGPIWAVISYPLLIVILMKPAMKEISEFAEMARGVKMIRNGSHSHKIPYASCRELSLVIDDINNIAEGFNVAVRSAVKAENMKSELITNVSHDLKTPLTSIIGYVDLLEGVEDLPAEARDYIAVIKQKSDRLKNIISDLFDLSKTTSGNIELELEKLDIKKLMEQTLADMSDSIEASGKTIKQSFPENPVMIYADGKRLYRVFQNIIDNALKYSMDKTRIFVTLKQVSGKALAEIKNISAYEMDFLEDEIVERFTRGDKTRGTEGSGLGLSIARSFTEACGGILRVVVDGDQFKVMIEFEIFD
ncbi:MAG: HAMP domain-containing sensor histidine kinase [Proteocatella sp.]